MRLAPRLLAVRGVAIVLVAAACACGCGQQGPVPAPTSFERFQAQNKVLACEYPADWESSGGVGKAPTSRVVFQKGPAKIAITADLAGSLIAGAPGPTDNPNIEPPVVALHERGRERVAEDLPGYEEVGPPAVIQTGQGEGRQSEFTATGSLGKKIHGYRATVLGNDRRFSIVASCPESDWENLKPAFNRVIQSLAPASRI